MDFFLPIVGIGFGILAIISIGIHLAISFHFTRLLVLRPAQTADFTLQDGMGKGEFDERLLSSFQEVHMVESKFGYQLACHAAAGKEPGRKTAIFCHGITWTWHGMLKYLSPFIEEGWNLVLFDSRGHGETKGPRPSYGYYEKDDLASVVSWARARFPDTNCIGLFGESMGAATVIQALEAGVDASFAVCDSSFSDLRELSISELRKAGLPGFLIPAVLSTSGVIVRMLADFRISDIAPRDSLKSISIPILFFHGGDDDLVPVSMAHAMEKACNPNCHSKLIVVEKAGHSGAWAADPDAYNAAVAEFIRENSKNGISRS